MYAELLTILYIVSSVAWGAYSALTEAICFPKEGRGRIVMCGVLNGILMPIAVIYVAIWSYRRLSGR